MSNEDPEIPENRYSLKNSTKLIGQLYPVLKAKDGEVLDGFHRSEADGSWRSEILENIDSEEKKLAARLIANFHRRRVPREEKAKWINELAELYKKQGLRVESESTGSPGQGSNEIADRLCQVTGISKKTVTFYLQDRFKQMNYSRGADQHQIQAPASEVIQNIIDTRCSKNSGYARRLLQRYQEELLQSPTFRAQVLSMLPRHNGSAAPIVGSNSGSVIGSSEQLPPGVVRDKSGFLVYERPHGKKYVMSREEKRALSGLVPKGYGLPKISRKPVSIELDEPEMYYKLFHEAFPDCKCSGCDHFKECDVAINPDE